MSLKATRFSERPKRNEISMKAIVQVIPKCPQAKDTRKPSNWRTTGKMETETGTESSCCRRNEAMAVFETG